MMRRTLTVTLAILCLFSALSLMPRISLAQTSACIDPAECGGSQGANTSPTFVPLANYSRSTQFTNLFSQNSLTGYINALFTTALSVGAIIAVLRLAYAGYMYMGSADMWSNKQAAREMIGDTIIGLLILFAIYLILQQINPKLLDLNLLNDIPKGSTTPASTPTTPGPIICADGLPPPVGSTVCDD